MSADPGGIATFRSTTSIQCIVSDHGLQNGCMFITFCVPATQMMLVVGPGISKVRVGVCDLNRWGVFDK